MDQKKSIFPILNIIYYLFIFKIQFKPILKNFCQRKIQMPNYVLLILQVLQKEAQYNPVSSIISLGIIDV